MRKCGDAEKMRLCGNAEMLRRCGGDAEMLLSRISAFSHIRIFSSSQGEIVVCVFMALRYHLIRCGDAEESQCHQFCKRIRKL
jgi:hypothetical protein